MAPEKIAPADAKIEVPDSAAFRKEMRKGLPSFRQPCVVRAVGRRPRTADCQGPEKG